MIKNNNIVDEFESKQIKDIRQKQRTEQKRKENKDKKLRNKTYLKGQHGIRKYYDYDKLDELGFDEIYDKESDRPMGCTPKVGQKFNNYIAIF